MTDYKSLYEQTLKENKELKERFTTHETIDKLEIFINKLKEEVAHHKASSNYYYCQSEMNGTVISTAKDKQVEINKLKEEINKLKEFALHYWSGGVLGSEAWDRPDEWEDMLDAVYK